jgi:hypothetical protein
MNDTRDPSSSHRPGCRRGRRRRGFALLPLLLFTGMAFAAGRYSADADCEHTPSARTEAAPTPETAPGLQ